MKIPFGNFQATCGAVSRGTQKNNLFFFYKKMENFPGENFLSAQGAENLPLDDPGAARTGAAAWPQLLRNCHRRPG